MKNDWSKDKAMEIADSRIINYSGTTLCASYRNPLEQCENAAQAIRLYKNCISWALQERYPTKGELLAVIPKETLAENGIYVDTEFHGERIDDHICVVFLNCKGWIRTGLNVEKAIIPMLYLSEQSNLKIEVEDRLTSPIPVELYYGSKAGGNKGLLSIKNCNRLKAEDNKGFAAEQLAVDPDINNVDL